MQILDAYAAAMQAFPKVAQVSEYLSQYLSYADLTLLGEQRRPARAGGLNLGGLSFALVDFGGAVQLRANIQSDYHIIMACLRGSADLAVDEKSIRLEPSSGFLARPTQSIVGRFSPDCFRLMIRIDPKILGPEGFLELNEAINPSNPQLAPMFDQIQLILSSPTMMQMLSANAFAAQQMADLLVFLLKSAGTLYPKPQPYQIVSRDVRRAEVFISQHSADAVSLSDIVKASGVSVRALQNNFLRFRQTSPTQYLRDVRLAVVRESLLQADRLTRISTVALESGFTHLGRFSIFYRKKYGESPSETLRRAVCSGMARLPTCGLHKSLSGPDPLYICSAGAQSGNGAHSIDAARKQRVAHFGAFPPQTAYIGHER